MTPRSRGYAETSYPASAGAVVKVKVDDTSALTAFAREGIEPVAVRLMPVLVS